MHSCLLIIPPNNIIMPYIRNILIKLPNILPQHYIGNNVYSCDSTHSLQLTPNTFYNFNLTMTTMMHATALYYHQDDHIINIILTLLHLYHVSAVLSQATFTLLTS